MLKMIGKYSNNVQKQSVIKDKKITSFLKKVQNKDCSSFILIEKARPKHREKIRR